MRQLWAVLLAFSASLGLAHAGTMGLAWDANTDSDLAGYRVYYGTSAGVYSSSVDVGNVTTHTLSGLTACTRYYVAVKAYDTGGLESASHSNEINGLPRPVVTTVSPSSAEQGASVTLTIAGESFDTGSSVEFTGAGITILATRRDSCSQLSVDIRIDAAAATTARDVTVMNPDRSFGTKTAGFTVATNAAPTVSSTSPTAGATGVAVGVRPTVTFSEAMDGTSITSSTVRLLDSNNQPVAQAAGSPALSTDKKTATITPSANLGFDKQYKIVVTGGFAGVKDTTGKTMAADYTQNPSFTTASAPDTTAPTVASTTPIDGALGIDVNVKPTVTFSEAMLGSSVTSSTVQLLDASGNPVAQAAGSPSLSPDGKTATITPAAALPERATFRTRVIGGTGGVKDLAGNPLASTFTQGIGFTTLNLPPGPVRGARRADTK